MMNSLLLIIKTPPYGSAQFREAIDIAFASATFDRKTEIVFTGNSVIALKDNSLNQPIKTSSLYKLLNSLPMYGVEDIYVEEDTLEELEFTTKELMAGIQKITSMDIRKKITEFDQVWVI